MNGASMTLYESILKVGSLCFDGQLGTSGRRRELHSPRANRNTLMLTVTGSKLEEAERLRRAERYERPSNRIDLKIYEGESRQCREHDGRTSGGYAED
jgi:hypothetical protein